VRERTKKNERTRKIKKEKKNEPGHLSPLCIPVAFTTVTGTTYIPYPAAEIVTISSRGGTEGHKPLI
jgi:hypothetical protein